MPNDDQKQKLRERYENLSALYEQMKGELDKLKKEEKELRLEIEEVINQQKMDNILGFIKQN